MRSIARALACVVAVGVVAQAAPAWTITVEPQKKIRANFDTPMKIGVRDGQGKPVSNATVELVVTMIDMDHGEHTSPAKMVAPGVYEGTTNFFMVGAWMLEVRVKKGTESKVQKIRIDVKE